MASADVVVLDGPTGTELSRRGYDTKLPLWSARPLAEHPDAVTAIHREYLQAGAQVLTTCTFRTHARNLARGPWAGRADELNRLAVRCARDAIEAEGIDGARVAGSIAPLEDCYRPDRVPGDAALAEEHAQKARSLADAGVDVLLVETMNTRRESEAALRAAVATGTESWCSWVTDGSGHLLSGESLTDAARAASELGARALMVNCVPTIRISADIETLATATELPFGGYGNIGHANDIDGWSADLMLDPATFAEHMLAFRESGATLLGGCCGVEPRHIGALADALAAEAPQ